MPRKASISSTIRKLSRKRKWSHTAWLTISAGKRYPAKLGLAAEAVIPPDYLVVGRSGKLAAGQVDCAHLAYVDCSNLFIEGQNVSAVARGMARSLEDARQRGVIDFGYRLDLHRLMALLGQTVGGEGDMRAVVFGSVTDSNAGLWRHAAAASFEVVTVERGFAGKEKRLDTSVVTRLCRDAYRHGDPRRDRITLVAGDGDYEPAVTQLVADGFAVTVLYWAHASRELREAATTFQALDAYVGDLALA